MTSTHVIERIHKTTDRPTRTSISAQLWRLCVGLLGAVGAMLLVVGVRLPWVSTFEGLIEQNGWGSRNGNLLIAAALLAAGLSIAQLIHPTPWLRWLLAGTGLSAAGFAGYLIIQLFAVTQDDTGMVFVKRESGLYVAAAGAALIFSTIFLPMPGSIERKSDTNDGLGAAPALSTSDTATRHNRRWQAPLRSPLRYPAAMLALAAGLVHVPVTPEHLREAPYIGILFILLTVACVLLATMVLVADSPLAWTGLGTVCLLAVLGYLASRAIGLPLIADDVGNWLEPLGIAAVCTESSVAILAADALWQRRTRTGTLDAAT